jgi:hypothetical protein
MSFAIRAIHGLLPSSEVARLGRVDITMTPESSIDR